MAENSLNGPTDEMDLPAAAEERLQKTEDTLKKAADSFSLDDIHDFRVEVKKLKAFLRLLKRHSEKPEKLKFPKFLDKIYKSLGCIRELQLQEKKLVKAVSSGDNPLQNTFSNLFNQIDIVREKTKELLNYEGSWKKTKKRIKKFIPEKLTKYSAENYLYLKVLELKEVLAMKRISIIRLHGMRKILKDLQYNYPYWKICGAAEGQALPSPDEIHDTGSMIGDLHDIYAATGILESLIKNYPVSEDEQKKLFDIRASWNRDRETLRQTIDEVLEKFRGYPAFATHIKIK